MGMLLFHINIINLYRFFYFLFTEIFVHSLGTSRSTLSPERRILLTLTHLRIF